MTRKDFELIAGVLRTEHAGYADVSDGAAAIEAVAFRFADELAQDNPRFDRKRFLAAALKD